jgi:hypothetical protein
MENSGLTRVSPDIFISLVQINPPGGGLSEWRWF